MAGKYAAVEEGICMFLTAQIFLCLTIATWEPIPQGLRDAALGRELAMDSGSLRFCVTVAPDFLALAEPLSGHLGMSYRGELMLQEIGQGVDIEYYWLGFDVWRLDIIGKDGVCKRSINCDGLEIATDSKTTWDIRYHTSFTHDPLYRECHELLWPFHIVAASHVFPLTGGRQADYSKAFTVLALTLEEPAGSGHSVHLGLRTRPGWDGKGAPGHNLVGEYRLDESRGYAPTMTRSMKSGLSSSFEAPIQIPGLGYVASTCTAFVRAGEEDKTAVLWQSKLVGPILDDLGQPRAGTFAIPLGIDVERIAWPEKDGARPTAVTCEPFVAILIIGLALLVGVVLAKVVHRPEKRAGG